MKIRFSGPSDHGSPVHGEVNIPSPDIQDSFRMLEQGLPLLERSGALDGYECSKIRRKMVRSYLDSLKWEIIES